MKLKPVIISILLLGIHLLLQSCQGCTNDGEHLRSEPGATVLSSLFLNYSLLITHGDYPFIV